MSNRIKDLNSPSPWNMRIWDEEKNQWLCDGEDDVLPYYGFDIRGGEVTTMQSMDWVYRQFEHGRKLIWERSTGLTDKNGKEIYEGDIVNIQGIRYYVDFAYGGFWFNNDNRGWKGNRPFTHFQEINDTEVIGNIHENPELLGGEG